MMIRINYSFFKMFQNIFLIKNLIETEIILWIDEKIYTANFQKKLLLARN
jgi:hypothetical protein